MRAPLGSVAASESRARTRSGTRALALSPFRLGRGLGRFRRRLFLVDEDLLRRLAFEQGDELLGVDRLPLQQQLRNPLKLLAAFAQQALRGLVGALDDAADLVVDLARDLIRVVGLGAELTTEEGLAA